MHPGERRLVDRFPDELRLIGAIVASWNGIEFMLCFVIAHEANEDVAGVFEQATSIISNSERLRALRMAVLAGAKTEERRNLLSAILDEAESCLKLRNKRAHAVLASGQDGKLSVFAMRGSPKSAETVTVDALTADLERLRALQARIREQLGTHMTIPTAGG